MQLDWMQWLEIHLNVVNNNEFTITQHQIGQYRKENSPTEKRYQGYNNEEIKDLSVKINLKEGAQIGQQKQRSIPIHLQE